MQPKMSEEKTTPVPTIFFTQTEVSPPYALPKPHPHRKYIIFAVTGVVVTAIILTAILVGMHLFTGAQKDILKFSYNQDKDTTEDVVSDPNTNIVQYHVNGPKYEMWVVNDFNRDLHVMKVKIPVVGIKCFVTPLNRTFARDPSKFSGKTMDRNMTSTLTYRAADTPIEDTSFLSKKARDECRGVSIYWIYPICNANDKNDFDESEIQSGDHLAFRRSVETATASPCCCCCQCCRCCKCCSSGGCETIE